MKLKYAQNIVLYHINDTKDDVCGTSKKTQPGTKGITSNSHILGAKSVEPGLEMDLNIAYLSQFSMLESTQNII